MPSKKKVMTRKQKKAKLNTKSKVNTSILTDTWLNDANYLKQKALLTSYLNKKARNQTDIDVMHDLVKKYTSTYINIVKKRPNLRLLYTAEFFIEYQSTKLAEFIIKTCCPEQIQLIRNNPEQIYATIYEDSSRIFYSSPEKTAITWNYDINEDRYK